MPTYITLFNWTDQGIRGFKETVERANAARDLASRMGGEIKELFWTIGPYDLVGIGEFPDEQSGWAYLLAVGAQGNVRTTTLLAHSAEEMTQIIGKLG